MLSTVETHKTTTAVKSTVAKIQADPGAKSVTDASRKLRIHVICILVAGTISTVLYLLHIGNAEVLGFGPAAPSVGQEIFDRIFRL
jgi:hypothetical protein